ncbi:hypothetical protein H072_9988 [Dactylellina haptotyla CBS 200.50]|uniref:FAD-binding domain-containing protein n=1 Tax=Dactylellina haptotyla (strain CBS 200.50) TaxID=1284197 RepID=S8BBE4_DACHA|nr:hypothetical protein H072_9988 [Dactylellina haptotyla CBS 200.50]
MPLATQAKSNKANATPVVDAKPQSSKGAAPIVTLASLSSHATPFDAYKATWSNFKATCPLKVLVIGAGVGGLTAAIGLTLSGHKVVIYEAVPTIKEAGAGIQVAPNASRILERFGVLEEIKKDAIMMERNSLRGWKEDVEIGWVPLMPSVGEKYNAPLMVVHRADLQRILLARAVALGVRIHTSSPVVACSPNFSASIMLGSGEWISGDIVIAADGIKSFVRAEIARRKGYKDTTVSTGDAAYRVVIDEERMRGDEEALKLLRGDVGSRWMGPGGHIMAYPVRSHKLYNMVLIHPIRPQQIDTESWTSPGSKAEMLKTYAGWNSTVRHLLSYVPDDGEVMEWTLNSHSPLPSWVEGKFVLIGDACHPMLPYVAQGAANAIEDAAVLTVALGLMDSPEKIKDALKAYEVIRKERGEAIQASARETQRILHLPDGKEQEERDRRIRESTEAARREGNGEKRNPDLWADQQWQEFMWGVDVMKDTMERWEDITRR